MAYIDTMSGQYDYTYLSLGAGVQSSALLVLACTTELVPTPNAAVFADTGDEPPWVYEYLKVLSEFAAQYGVQVHIGSAGKLSQWVVERQKNGQRFVNVPLFTANEDGSKGMLRRQCTREFKIAPIEKKVRELMGYQPRQRIKKSARALIGISLDEAQRMKPSRTRWVTNTYPLVDLGISRSDCEQIVINAGLPKPQKSACVFCPYHSDRYWQWMKDEHPAVFQDAVKFDESIRDMSMRGRNAPAYVHRSCVPLDQAVFNSDDPNQVDMFGNECEGMCGV